MPAVIDRHAVQQLVQQGAQLVDVLGARDYEAEHIPGAINIPLTLRISRSTVHRVLAGEASPALDAPVYTLAMMSQILRRALSKETCSECGATFYRPRAVPDEWGPAGWIARLGSRSWSTSRWW